MVSSAITTGIAVFLGLVALTGLGMVLIAFHKNYEAAQQASFLDNIIPKLTHKGLEFEYTNEEADLRRNRITGNGQSVVLPTTSSLGGNAHIPQSQRTGPQANLFGPGLSSQSTSS